MEDKVKMFMTFEDLLEVIHNPESVPDSKLKMNILALCYSGESIDSVWEYILSHDNDGQD